MEVAVERVLINTWTEAKFCHHTGFNVSIIVLSSAPTVLVDVAEDDALMKEEIFGPILPIITVESLQQGIDFMNRQEKPLALYVFSNNSSVSENTAASHLHCWRHKDIVVLLYCSSFLFKVVKKVLENTSSGGFCSNDGIIHMTLPSLPFGGVGMCGRAEK